MTGLGESAKFDVLSGLIRNELYLRLTTYRVGLLPFKANPHFQIRKLGKDI